MDKMLMMAPVPAQARVPTKLTIWGWAERAGRKGGLFDQKCHLVKDPGPRWPPFVARCRLRVQG